MDWVPKRNKFSYHYVQGNPPQDLKDKGVIDNGCSRHMTRNISYLTDYEEIDRGFVTFGEFKLTDENHVLIKVPRTDNMYSVDLRNVVPQGGLTCLFAKATLDESTLWHRRLGHGFSVARTPQQNIAARWENRILIEATRTMLADLKLPTTFWAEAINTTCYVQNRVSVIKPHNKTPYELFLGKFNRQADEGFSIGYYTNSKAFRVFNSKTRIVEENLHVKFSENTPNIAESGLNWLFDIHALTISMNYKPVVARNQSNGSAGTKACNILGKTRMGTVPDKDYILLPLWTEDPLKSSSLKDSPGAGYKPSEEEEKKDTVDPGNEDSKAPIIKEPRFNQEKDSVNSTNRVNDVSFIFNDASNEVNVVGRKSSIKLPNDLNMPELEDISIFEDSNEDVFGADADLNNLESTFQNVVPQGGLTCLFAKATLDESTLWHRTLGHRESSVARTPQQNGVAERKNRTLIEAARTMLANLKLPTTFWAKAVNTACYVKNRVLVIKRHNKTPYELFLGRKPALSFMRPFWCPITILNTIDHLRYSTNSKAFRVFNSRTRIVEENLYVKFSENTPNIAGSGPNWIFDIDALTKSMNYNPVVTGNQSNGSTCTQTCDNKGKGSTNPNDPHHTPTLIQSLTSKPQKKQKQRKPMRQDTEETHLSGPGDNVADEAFNAENVSHHSNDPLHSGKDSIQIKELMKICTNLQNRVINLETTKITQALEIDSLKRRVKKLEKKQKSRTHKLKRLYKVSLSERIESSNEEQSLGEEYVSKQWRNIADIDADAETTLVDETAKDQGSLNDQDEIMFDADKDIQGKEIIVEKAVTDKEVSAVKEVDDAQDQPKIRGIVIKDHKEPSKSTTTTTLTSIANNTRPKAKGIVMQEPSKAPTTTTTLTSIANNTRPKAKGIVMQEPSKAPTTTTILIPSHVKDKGKGKRKNGMDTKVVVSSKKAEAEIAQESSSKRVGDELEQESAKKQMIDNGQEAAELKKYLEIVPDNEDDVTIDATPLSSMSPTIIDYKIHKEGRKSYFQIIIADGSSQMYYTFSKMLKNFNRENLEVLWNIVKARFEKVQPVDDMDSFLLQNLKTMFEHHVEDSVWKNQQGLAKVKNWKLFDSCGVHCVSMQNTIYYLLVEKMLQVDYKVEMAYDLLRLVRRQLREGYIPE
nr:retrovirus-related Pol polyprotein from transposon TNT 1-94 [Tanacetum cinerariifolium]